MEELWILEPDQSYEVLNNKHDKGYKYLLSVKRIFVQLLRSFIKKSWVDEIGENNVEKIDKSFILQDFKGKEADLVYKVCLDGREVFFYFLLELQSTVDHQMPYRLLQYMMEIWRTILKDTGKNLQARKDFKLPVIVPLVLYNGLRQWTVSRNFRDVFNAKDMFGNIILDFEYILFDVTRYNETELLELGNLIGAVFFIDQKPRYEEIIERLGRLMNNLKKLNEEDLILFKEWLRNIMTRGLKKEEAVKIEEIITGNEEVGEMVYALEIAIRNKIKEVQEQGLQQGIEQGIEQGIQQGKMQEKVEVAKKLIGMGFNDEQIKIVTGLTSEEMYVLLQGQD